MHNSCGLRFGIVVKIETKPWFNNRIDIQHAEFAAMFHDVEGTGINGQVYAKALGLHLRSEAALRCPCNFPV